MYVGAAGSARATASGSASGAAVAEATAARARAVKVRRRIIVVNADGSERSRWWGSKWGCLTLHYIAINCPLHFTSVVNWLVV